MTNGSKFFVLWLDGAEAVEDLPSSVWHLGPWSGSREGDVERLRVPLRLLLKENGVVILYDQHPERDAVASVHALGR